MEQFIRFLEQLGVHRWEMLFLMLEAMTALWLLIAFSRFYIKQKHFRRYQDGWLIETKQAAFQDGLEMQCVFRAMTGFRCMYRMDSSGCFGHSAAASRRRPLFSGPAAGKYGRTALEPVSVVERRGDLYHGGEADGTEAWYRVFITRSQDQKYDRFWFQDITEIVRDLKS